MPIKIDKNLKYLFVIFILAFALRIIPPLITGMPSNTDIFLHENIITETIGRENFEIGTRYGYPLGYHSVMIVLELLSSIDSMIWQMFFSSLFVSLTAITFYLLFSNYNKKIALWGSLIFALSPISILFSSGSGMPFNIAIFLVMMIFYFIFSNIATKSKTILIYIFSVALPLIHSSTSSVLAASYIIMIFTFLIFYIFVLSYKKTELYKNIAYVLVSAVGFGTSYFVYPVLRGLPLADIHMSNALKVPAYLARDVPIFTVIGIILFVVYLYKDEKFFSIIIKKTKKFVAYDIVKTKYFPYIATIFIFILIILQIFKNSGFDIFQYNRELITSLSIAFIPVLIGLPFILSFFGMYYILKERNIAGMFFVFMLLLLSFVVVDQTYNDLRENFYTVLFFSLISLFGCKIFYYIKRDILRKSVIIIAIILLIAPAIFTSAYVSSKWIDREELKAISYLGSITAKNETVTCISSYCEYIAFYTKLPSVIYTEFIKNISNIDTYKIRYFFISRHDIKRFHQVNMSLTERILDFIGLYKVSDKCVSTLCELEKYKKVYSTDAVTVYDLHTPIVNVIDMSENKTDNITIVSKQEENITTGVFVQLASSNDVYNQKKFIEYNGELYIGGFYFDINKLTSGLIYRYNGEEFTQVKTPRIGEIGTFVIYNNSLYIGTVIQSAATVLKLENGEFIKMPVINKDELSSIRSFAIFNDSLYMGSDSGLFMLHGDKWERINENLNGTFTDVTFGKIESIIVYNDILYIGGKKGIFIFNVNITEQVANTKQVGSISLLIPYNGSLYAAGYSELSGGGFFKLEDKKLVRLADKDEAGTISGYLVYENELYLWGDEGIFKLQNNRLADLIKDYRKEYKIEDVDGVIIYNGELYFSSQGTVFKFEYHYMEQLTGYGELEQVFGFITFKNKLYVGTAKGIFMLQ